MGLLVFLVVLGVLVIVHEFGHFIIAKKIGVKVEEFSVGFGRRILTRKKNNTVYSVGMIPLGGFVKLAGDNSEEYKGTKDEYLARPPYQRAAIVFCGPLLNYILGIVFLWFIFVVGYPSFTTKVGGLIDGLGAQEAGLQKGDQIISVDGQKTEYWEDIQRIIRSRKPLDVVRLSIARDKAELTVGVTLKEKQISDVTGKKRGVPLLGIEPAEEMVTRRHGVVQSLFLSVSKTWDITVMTYTALGNMITGNLSLRDSVTGPLGIYYITSKAAHVGIMAVLQLVALLSVSLAIFNLLPFPVLDGGHLLFLCIEKIRGKALSAKVETIITRIGFSLLITLAVFVTYNDIVRFFGDKLMKLFHR